MSAAILLTLAPELFKLGTKGMGMLGRDKKGAALLLRLQESDLLTIADQIDAMVQGEGEVNREVLGMLAGLVRRGSVIADLAADALVGDDDSN